MVCLTTLMAPHKPGTAMLYVVAMVSPHKPGTAMGCVSGLISPHKLSTAMVCVSGIISPHKVSTAMVCVSGVISPHKLGIAVVFVTERASLHGAVVPRCVCFRPGVPSQTSRAVVCDSPRPLLSQAVRRCGCPPTSGTGSRLGSVSLTDRAWMRPSSHPHKKQLLPFGEKDVQVLRFTEIVKHHKLSCNDKERKKIKFSFGWCVLCQSTRNVNPTDFVSHWEAALLSTAL